MPDERLESFEHSLSELIRLFLIQLYEGAGTLPEFWMLGVAANLESAKRRKREEGNYFLQLAALSPIYLPIPPAVERLYKLEFSFSLGVCGRMASIN